MPRYAINYNNLFGGVSPIEHSDAKELIETNFNSFKGYKDKDSIYFPLVLKDEDISVLTEDVAKKIREKETNVFMSVKDTGV